MARISHFVRGLFLMVFLMLLETVTECADSGALVWVFFYHFPSSNAEIISGRKIKSRCGIIIVLLEWVVDRIFTALGEQRPKENSGSYDVIHRVTERHQNDRQFSRGWLLRRRFK